VSAASLLSFPGPYRGPRRRSFAIACWAVLLALIVAFLGYYALHYVIGYTSESYDPYWPRSGGLLLHLGGSLLALVMGPWQFWTGLRQRVPRIHRWTGRLFVLGVGLGVTGAAYLAITTTFGWAWGVGVGALAVAWAVCTGMAFYAIRRGNIAVHKQWMVRTYVVTFAFVTDRLLDDWLPTAQLEPVGDKIVMDIWLSWVVPLFATIVIQSLAGISRRADAPADALPLAAA
jgi:uncharacterized membrane protein